MISHTFHLASETIAHAAGFNPCHQDDEYPTASVIVPAYGLILLAGTQRSCSYTDLSIRHLLGYPLDNFLNDGFAFLLSLIHPADLQTVVQLYKELFRSYYLCPIAQRSGLRFTMHYRLRTSKSNFKVALHQCQFLDISAEGKPLIEQIQLTDISSLKDTGPIKLTIQHLDNSGLYERYQAPTSGGTALTAREKEILAYIGIGLTSRQIANRLYISFNTVKSHRKNILCKTGAANVIQALQQNH